MQALDGTTKLRGMPRSPVSRRPERAASYVISLRPAGDHAAMRRAAARCGLRTIALSPWRIAARDDDEARRALAIALAAPVAVFTSPPAVRAAAALLPEALAAPGRIRIAVGAGTRAALARAGVPDALAPARQDSEGLLALPPLAAARVRGRDVGLVTAPGGRGKIPEALAERGARMRRADVYARVPLAPDPRAIGRLQAARGDLLLPLTSGEALQRILDALPEDAAARLRRARVVAASPRLAALAEAAGFAEVCRADAPQPAALLRAAHAAALNRDARRRPPARRPDKHPR